MIAIFDYGAGNLQSVKNTLGAIGAPYELVRDPEGLRRATKIILPGVGHFGQIMRALDELKVRETLVDRIRAGVPFLGICLGLQALFTSSEAGPRRTRTGPVRRRRQALSRRPENSTHGLGSTRNQASNPSAGRRRRQTIPLLRPQLLLPGRAGNRGHLRLLSCQVHRHSRTQQIVLRSTVPLPKNQEP